MSFGIIFSQILVMFLMVIVGYIMGRRGTLSERISHDISVILLEVATPALIINSMIREFDLDLIKDAMLCFAIGMVYFLGMIAVNQGLSRLLRVNRSHRGLWIVAASFTNPGFMGFPLALAIFGNDGLFMAAFINMAFNILIYTIGERMVIADVGNGREKPPLIRTLLSPINISTLIGLVIFFGQIPLAGALEHAPAWLVSGWTVVTTVIKNLGNLVTPLAMFLVGLAISRSSLRRTVTDRDAMTAVIVDMIAGPLLLIGVLKLLPFREGFMVVPVSVLIMLMSVASAVQMLADRYDGDSEFAGHAIFLSNVLCLISVPLLMMLV